MCRLEAGWWTWDGLGGVGAPLQSSKIWLRKGTCIGTSHKRHTKNLDFSPAKLLGQMFATIWLITSGFSNALKDGTLTTFSCQRRVDQFLIYLSGAYWRDFLSKGPMIDRKTWKASTNRLRPGRMSSCCSEAKLKHFWIVLVCCTVRVLYLVKNLSFT